MSEGYSLEGLEHGIERARHNITILEDAIDRERNTIKEYRIMIDSIEAAARKMKEAQENVHVEIVDDNT